MLFLFFLQDVTHIDGGYRPLVRVNVLDLCLSLVGFQVIMSGRFWVITEVQRQGWIVFIKRGKALNLEGMEILREVVHSVVWSASTRSVLTN